MLGGIYIRVRVLGDLRAALYVYVERKVEPRFFSSIVCLFQGKDLCLKSLLK